MSASGTTKVVKVEPLGQLWNLWLACDHRVVRQRFGPTPPKSAVCEFCSPKKNPVAPK